jgi:REP element-mobilizing transposase RayT
VKSNKRKNKQQATVWNPKAAGRPKRLTQLERNSRIIHRTRPDLPANKPVHVTLKSDWKKTPCFRNKDIYREIRKSMQRAREKGIRIIEYTIQKDHIHLLIESEHRQELALAMRSLSISLTKRLSNLTNRKIKAFKDRYHLHILRSIKEVSNVKKYILKNGQKHLVSDEQDYYSSRINECDFKLTDSFKCFLNEIKALLDPPEFWITGKATS